MTTGSGIFSAARAAISHLVHPGGGLSGEIWDLRRDVLTSLSPLAGIVVQEFTNALATAANNMMAATASVSAAAVTLLPAVTPATGSLTAATITNLGAAPRQLQFTTAGGTPAHQPSTATITGLNERGVIATEVVELKQEAGAFLSNNFWSSVTSIVLAADGTGTGATLAIGLGAKLGLTHAVRSRAGRVAVLQEIAGGSVVTNGVVKTASEGVAATTTGTTDLVTPTPTLPTTETLIVSIDGGAPLTVTFATPANMAALLVAINAVCGAGFATNAANYLKLTSPTSTVASKIVISASSTALTILGLTAGTYKGTGNGTYGSYTPNASLDGSTDFCLYYDTVAV